MSRSLRMTMTLVGALLLVVGSIGVGYYLYGVISGPSVKKGALVVSKGCGVTKTGNGYSFSWLHVSQGGLVDEKNCAVTLTGFNWSQLEFGNGVGGGNQTKITQERMAWFNQTFRMNVWRIPVQAYWWNQNVDVPLAGMKYQAWIRQVVSWAEANGDYVILTKGPQYHYPPCGGSVTYCPPQNAAQKGPDPSDPREVTSGQYIDAAVAMWKSVAKIYANDPAVLYDSWNEMHDIDLTTWQTNSNTLINTIRSQNPRSLVFLGGPNFKQNINGIIKGKIPDFKQENLVYDFHVYPGYSGTYKGKNCQSPLSYIWNNWPSGADEQVNFAQQHGKAVSFSEWGGCNDLDDYNQAITSYARGHHISLVYYDETNVTDVTGGDYQLNDNGLRVQIAYSVF